MSDPKPRHFVPVPRDKFATVMRILAVNHLRSDWVLGKRLNFADRLDELFTAADDPGPARSRSTKPTYAGLPRTFER